jgi:type II secretory pathway component PulF
MSDVTLDRVLELNKELAALSAAGLTLELGAPGTSVEAVLDRASSSLALRTSRGQSLADALQDNDDLPGIYRHALQSGMQSDDLTSVLDCVSRKSIAEDELRRTFGQSFVQPLILLALAYAGFILLCLRFAPPMEGIYDQLRQEPNAGIAMLRAARLWMPVWVPLVPVLMLAAVVFWRRGVGSTRLCIPCAGRYAATIAHANFAEQLANLLKRDVPLEEALELASGVTGDDSLVAASAELAAAHHHGERLVSDDPRLRGLPPLLRWALTGDLGDQSLSEILRFAAQTYRQSADRQAAVWRLALPTLIGALVGGVIVFAYGLSMFGSLIGLWRDLSVYHA